MSDTDVDEHEGSAEDDADLAQEDGTDANPVEAATAAPAVPHAKKITKAEQVKAASAAEETWGQQIFQNVPAPSFTCVTTGLASSYNTRASVQNSSWAMPR